MFTHLSRPQAPPFSPSSQGELEPVLTQVLPFPSSSGSIIQTLAPALQTSTIGANKTVDLSVLPLYYAYVTSSMTSHNCLSDSTAALDVQFSRTPVCSMNSIMGSGAIHINNGDRRATNAGEMDTRGFGHMGNPPWNYDRYWHFYQWGGQQIVNPGNLAGNFTQNYNHPYRTTTFSQHSSFSPSSRTTAKEIPTQQQYHSTTTPLHQSSSSPQFFIPQPNPSIYATTTTTYPQFQNVNSPSQLQHPNFQTQPTQFASHFHSQTHYDPNLLP